MSDGRTEQATPKRRREARRKGQVARSAELPQAAALAAAVLVLPAAAGRLGEALALDWSLALGQAAGLEPARAGALLARSLAHAAMAVAPAVAVVGGAGVAASLAVSGARPNPHLLRPRFERLSPKAGIRRMVSKEAAWELLRTIAKLALLAAVAWGAWRAGLSRLLAGPASVGGALAVVGGATVSLLQRAAAAALVLGLADAVLARRRYSRALRMTRHEVLEEHRQSEGNPQSRAAIRARQARLSRSRMIAAVAGADVVLTNPTHLAVALAYAPGAPAPTVVAKGAGSVAERIKEEAARHRVPVLEDKPLARALFRQAEVGDHVPVALWRAVAEVLALVYRTRSARRGA